MRGWRSELRSARKSGIKRLKGLPRRRLLERRNPRARNSSGASLADWPRREVRTEISTKHLAAKLSTGPS